MNIWHVTYKQGKPITLWRTNPNIFRVTIDGNYTPILVNGNYTIIDRKYIPVLQQLPEQVTFQDIKIIDYSYKTETNNYIELSIVNKITHTSIHLQDSTGLKIWIFDGHIFVSDDLKEEISHISKDELVFNVGFSHFGA